MHGSDLPFVDQHATEVAADAPAVWAALLEVLDRTFSGSVPSAYARLVGCDPVAPSGPRPLARGSAVLGFRVVTVEPGRLLVLEGRHRFSTYALVFELSARAPGRTVLEAVTRAAFPGAGGAVYRQLLLRTGGHVLGVRRLLSGVRRRAERMAAPS